VARKARDYKAEYARRVASARAAGKSMREARGHAREPQERKERRARAYREHGVSPERLSRLRRAAKAHMLAALAGGKGPVNEATVDRGVKMMNGEMLALIPQLPPDHLRGLAGLSYAALILEYPDLENDDERNPFWYHPG
jgi:hypothetical protein